MGGAPRAVRKANNVSVAIDVKHLTRRFGAFVAVNDVSFEVRTGEIFGFLGSNGAGKSTTIRMLCGLLQPSSGTAIVGGIDVSADPEGVKRRIGYMSQRFSLYELLTVDQNIRFFGGVYGLNPERLESRRSFVIEMAGLARPRTQSGARPRRRMAPAAGARLRDSARAGRSSFSTSRPAASIRCPAVSSGASSTRWPVPA